MIERIAEVIGEADGRWQLRGESSACQGCDNGCSGRCRLFVGGSDGRISMPLGVHADLRAGQRVSLRIDDDALARAAWRGYGLALIGLLAGALLGFGSASWLAIEGWRDAATLFGALTGTFSAAILSKRHALAVSLHPIDAAHAAAPSQSSKSEPA